MNLQLEDLTMQAAQMGFRTEILEKVIQLSFLLNEIFDNHFLRQRLVLKGGTALNLFYFNLPRLSVDIDLNYIGSIDKNIMLEERKELEQTLFNLCQRSGFTIKRSATEHAGGKWRLGYKSAIQPSGNLEIDLSYLYRVALWPSTIKDSHKIGAYQAKQIPVLNLHELAAGKLTALMSRSASRDLYDAYRLLVDPMARKEIDRDCLRVTFIIYGAMNRHDWRTIKPSNINFDLKELENKLIPVLNQKESREIPWEQVVSECQEMLSDLFSFSQDEQMFFDLLLDKGEIVPALITDDPQLQEKIINHPGLLWKAQNVKKFKSSSHF